MKALDTNVLVRFLTEDDPGQYKKVLALFRAGQQSGERFFVDKIVMLEMIWVLETVYRYRREEILSATGKLLSLTVLAFENTEMLEKFTALAAVSRTELSDLLVGLSAESGPCETTLTFDRKAAKESKLFHLLT